jgi:hypothetical protein
MSKEIEIPMQNILQAVDEEVETVKAAQRKTKRSLAESLAELEKLLNGSDENSEEQEESAVAETVA